MSPIALGLDLILVTLLIVAVGVGWRLNRRLKALRDGQEGFVRAVGELDAAASRAESALTALRAASEDTHDALLARIETARGLIVRLDRSVELAERAAATAPPAPAPHATPVSPPLRAENRLGLRFHEALAAIPARVAPRPVPAPARAAPRPVPARSVDEDLFEAEPPADGALQRRVSR